VALDQATGEINTQRIAGLAEFQQARGVTRPDRRYLHHDA